MLRGLIKFSGIMLIPIVLFAAIVDRSPEKAPSHPFFEKDGFMVIAHQGGLGYWPSNTMIGFKESVRMGADVLEMDVRMSMDGHLVLVTRETVDSTTDGVGKVNELRLEEIRKLDAGYRWTPGSAPDFYPVEAAEAGYTKSPIASGPFPFRGSGHQIPTVDEVFRSFRGIRINIEIKQTKPPIAAALCKKINQYERSESTLVSSFDPDSLNAFRMRCPRVATSSTKNEARSLVLSSKLFLSRLYVPKEAVFLSPLRTKSFDILSSRFVRDAHVLGIQVHAWTINDKEMMRSLIDMGVDGIVTDYPDRLLEVLGR